MAIRLHRILGPGIRLAADAGDGERRPVWIQAATTGTWRGHPAHPKIEFTEQTFDEVLKNFRANPNYKQGEDGVGCAAVIRLDYEHTSEMMGSEEVLKSSIPQQGIPAPGFILELGTRPGEGDKIELWALVEMGEQLWGQVGRKEYRWTSVAIDPNAKNRVTDVPIGNTLTSLAITNNPFILGLEDLSESIAKDVKIAATAGQNGACIMRETKRGRRAQLIACSMEVWGEAETPQEVIVSLRSKFGLGAEATPSEVLMELKAFEVMHSNHSLPGDVDGQYIIGDIRRLLGMKLLSTDQETLDAAKKVIADLVEKEAASGGMGPLGEQGLPVTTKTSTPEIPQMSAKTLNARLAANLKLSADADDDAVVDAQRAQAAELASARKFKLSLAKKIAGMKHTGRLGGAIKRQLLSADEEDEAKLLDAVDGVVDEAEKGEAAKEVLDVFEQLKEALGADDLTDLLAKATKMADQANKYGGTVQELAALKAKLTDAEVKDAEEEVELIAACHGVEDRTKKLLLSQVIRIEKGEDGTDRKTVCLTGLETVRKDWPVSDTERQKVLLTSAVFADRNGMQKGGTVTGAEQTRIETTSLQLSNTGKQNDGVKAKVLLCAGRNDIEKAMSYLDTTDPSFKAVPEHMRSFHASQFFKALP